MLIRLTDTKGRDHWLNPLYIRSVEPRGVQCEVRLSFNIGMSSTIKINEPAEQVAETVSAGLMSIGAGAAMSAVVSEQHFQQQQQQAAAAAAMSG